ncbi:MAG TPA: hypothetical protein VNI83_14960 [Vicinamibacterales bacterium]|nr:hypothetical protein [Vicinamibacterales bacterium]
MSRPATVPPGLAAALLVLRAGLCAGQIVSPAPGAPAATPGPLARYAFHVSVLRSAPADIDYQWDAEIGGDLDLVDYGAGRVTFLATYETIVGDERRTFDPIQGNYLLDLSASWRAPAVELFGVLHHVSRHLSDREKRQPVDWNMVGGRVLGRLHRGRTTLVLSAHVLWVVQRAFVDYAREIGGEVALVQERGAGRALLLRASIARLGLIAGAARPVPIDARTEVGVRLPGRAAAVEIVGGLERRADAVTLAPGGRTAVLVGVRVVSP